VAGVSGRSTTSLKNNYQMSAEKILSEAKQLKAWALGTVESADRVIEMLSAVEEKKKTKLPAKTIVKALAKRKHNLLKN
jgi:hypothetical protein